MKCYCGSKEEFSNCCQPIIADATKAETAEQTMRARYSAFATGSMDFIAATHYPKNFDKTEHESNIEWAKNSKWLGLKIVDTKKGGPEDEKGLVEFQARYISDGEEEVHSEVAKFKKENGQWYFVDGHAPERGTLVREEPKVGRNDPCPCGSGKKYKKCCGKS